jgi:hypothetical protein
MNGGWIFIELLQNILIHSKISKIKLIPNKILELNMEKEDIF